LKRMNLVRQ